MAYKPNSLVLQSQSIAGRREWLYSDTGSLVSDAVVAGFFADAKDKGVKVDDGLTFIDRTTNIRVTGLFSVVQDTGTTQGTFVQDTH
jgi:hypothetical protein